MEQPMPQLYACTTKSAYKPPCVMNMFYTSSVIIFITNGGLYIGWLIFDIKLGDFWLCMHMGGCTLLLFVMYSRQPLFVVLYYLPCNYVCVCVLYSIRSACLTSMPYVLSHFFCTEEGLTTMDNSIPDITTNGRVITPEIKKNMVNTHTAHKG